MREFKPHDYQRLIISRILQQDRTSIFAGMGMGKTSSTLTALDGLFLSGDDNPALVLAPLRVCNSTWPEEARKWQHLRHIDVVPITGVEKERKEALKRDASIYACNYQNLPWLIEHYGNHWPFDKVIADDYPTEVNDWDDQQVKTYLEIFADIKKKDKDLTDTLGEVIDKSDELKVCPKCSKTDDIVDMREKKSDAPEGSGIKNLPDFMCQQNNKYNPDSNGCGWGGYIGGKDDKGVPEQWL